MHGSYRFTLPILAILLFAVLVSPGSDAATSADLETGNIYMLELQTLFSTLNWAGLKIENNAATLSDSDSNTPFTSILFNTPAIFSVNFPGSNLKDGIHYYAAMFASTFNISNVQNASAADLQQGGMFSQTHYPQFYPDYLNFSDNPSATFCCQQGIVTIGGVNFTSVNITLENNINYHILKYNDGGTDIPLFMVDLVDASCYNNTACVGQFFFPVSNTSYNFYSVSKFPVFNITLFVDGVQTNTIAQTALPYNLTMFVTNTLSGLPEANLSVYVAEELGQNIFIPFRLSGFVGESFSVGMTNDAGFESFVVAPTEYPSITNYSIFAGVVRDELLVNRETLSITNSNSVVSQSKQLTPTILNDNSKTAINAMNQIINFMFQWASQLTRAKRFVIEYETTNSSFKFNNLENASQTVLLKTGAPNVLTVLVKTNGVEVSTHSARIKENQGYLLMEPYTGGNPLTQKTRTHRTDFSTSTNFAVTPSSLGVIDSNVTLEILNPSSQVIANASLAVDPNLNFQPGEGVFFDDDQMKVIINNMNIVVNSLFTALNT